MSDKNWIPSSRSSPSRSLTRCESFLVALQAMSREENPGTVVPLLLVEVSQILLAGARLGAQRTSTPSGEYQPDVGPDPDLDAMRLRLARLLDSVDTYTYNFEPYEPDDRRRRSSPTT